MKKVLSFVLVLAMILGSVATAFAAKPVTVSADNTVLPFKDAETCGIATVLRDIGALEGKGDDIVDLKGTLTRAEAATLVVRALGLDELGKVPQATKFADVKKDAWYSGYVAIAAAQNIIQGRDAKTFAPEESISLNEAIALICQTLGYNSEHLLGAWPVNYVNAAKSLHLLGNAAEGTAVNIGNTAATREDFIKLLFNALECNMVEWVEQKNYGWYQGGEDVETITGQTLLETITGVVGATFDSLYDTEFVNVLTAEHKFANGFDASAYYGKPVTLLVKLGVEKGGNIGIWSTTAQTLTGKFVAKRGSTTEFTTFVASDGTEYKFYESATATAPYELKASDVSKFFRNGSVDTAAKALDTTTTYNVEVKFADKAKTKIQEIYSVSYWKADQTVVLNATQAAMLAGDLVKFNATTAYKFNVPFATTLASVTSVKKVLIEGSYQVEGAVTSLADVQKGDVVEIYANETYNTAGTITKLVVTRNTKTGTVSKADATSVTLADTLYKYAPGATKPMNGYNSTSEYALYLNAAGSVVLAQLAAEEAPATPYTYAFVTGLSVPVMENSKNGVAYIKVWLTVPGEGETAYDTSKFITAASVEALNDKLEGLSFTREDVIGRLVKVVIKDGKLVDATDTDLYEVTKINANGIVMAKEEPASKITADTKIYKIVTDTDLENAKNYKALTFDEVKDRTYEEDSVYYYANSKNVVEVVVISGSSVLTGEEKTITGAAYKTHYYDTAAKNYKVTFLTRDGEVTLACDPAHLGNWTQTSIGAVLLEGGQYVGFVDGVDLDLEKAIIIVDSETVREKLESAVLDGTKLTIGDEVAYVADGVQTWTLDLASYVDTKKANARFAVNDFNAAMNDDELKAVVLVDFDVDGEFDLILTTTGDVAL